MEEGEKEEDGWRGGGGGGGEGGRRRVKSGGYRVAALTTMGGLMCQRDSWGDKRIQDGTAKGLSLSFSSSLSLYLSFLCLYPFIFLFAPHFYFSLCLYW